MATLTTAPGLLSMLRQKMHDPSESVLREYHRILEGKPRDYPIGAADERHARQLVDRHLYELISKASRDSEWPRLHFIAAGEFEEAARIATLAEHLPEEIRELHLEAGKQYRKASVKFQESIKTDDLSFLFVSIQTLGFALDHLEACIRI